MFIKYFYNFSVQTTQANSKYSEFELGLAQPQLFLFGGESPSRTRQRYLFLPFINLPKSLKEAIDCSLLLLLAPCTWNSIFVTRYLLQATVTYYLIPVTRYLLPDTCYLILVI